MIESFFFTRFCFWLLNNECSYERTNKNKTQYLQLFIALEFFANIDLVRYMYIIIVCMFVVAVLNPC